jgi:hypothetical protein
MSTYSFDTGVIAHKGKVGSLAIALSLACWGQFYK